MTEEEIKKVKAEEYFEEKDALAKVREMNEMITMPEAFCPLTKTACTSMCICFKKAYLCNKKVGGVDCWEILGFYCSNAMFWGN